VLARAELPVSDEDDRYARRGVEITVSLDILEDIDPRKGPATGDQ